jgi:hypothetical protein
MEGILESDAEEPRKFGIERRQGAAGVDLPKTDGRRLDQSVHVAGPPATLPDASSRGESFARDIPRSLLRDERRKRTAR